MKLLRFGPPGAEKPGIMDGDIIRDLSRHLADIDGSVLDAASLERLRGIDPSSLPAIEGTPRIGPPVANFSKYMCIGLNYSDHAAETGNPIPENPILFMKANSAICGPNDTTMIPRGSVHTDYEVELGIIIGKPAKYVDEADALDFVAGYCVCNDVSERHFQNRISGNWTKGKSCDTFGPTGPWLVTKDEVSDVQNLNMTVDVNGERRQTGNTKTMIFNCAQIIAHLSQLMTLNPGDIIATGTPPGVAYGAGYDGDGFLRDGDRVDVWIEGLGSQTQMVGQDA